METLPTSVAVQLTAAGNQGSTAKYDHNSGFWQQVVVKRPQTIILKYQVCQSIKIKHNEGNILIVNNTYCSSL